MKSDHNHVVHISTSTPAFPPMTSVLRKSCENFHHRSRPPNQSRTYLTRQR